MHEAARVPVDDDVGDPSDVARDDRRFARHRLEVHDAERFVDRRADEHGAVCEHLAHLLARQHLRHEVDAVAFGPQDGDEFVGLRSEFGCVGCACQQHELHRLVEAERGASRWGTPFWRVMRPTKTAEGRSGSTPNRSRTSVSGSGR